MSTERLSGDGLAGRDSWGALAAIGFALLSVADMGFSSVAFTMGIQEANPLLAWAVERDLFVPVKLLLTGLVAGLIAWIYPRRYGRHVSTLALSLAGAAVGYHLWGLHALRMF